MTRPTRAWLAVVAGTAVAAVAVASVVPGPYAAVAAESPGAPFLQTAQLGPDDVGTLQRACQDCHSHDTKWPWYGRVVPMLWLLRKDVGDGRRLVNFSRWPEYGTAGQSQLLTLAAQDVASGTMPPRRYLWLHPEARLTDLERTGLSAALAREAARASASEPAAP